MKLTIHTFQLRLKHTFSISHESRDVMPSLVVELSQDGYSGYGEATETRYYGILLDEMVQTLERLRPTIEALPLHTPEQFWEALQPHLAQHPFILCALDEAAHDLHGKLHGQPVYARWGLKLDHLPISNFTIGIASIEEMVAKMEEQPWPLYKVKLGTDHDIEIVEALRQHTDAASASTPTPPGRPSRPSLTPPASRSWASNSSNSR
jgi:L-Ala-D/L-Glu epimerase